MATVGGAKEVRVLQPQAGQKQFRSIALSDPLGARPIAFGGGLLVPSKIGQVFLLDPESGAKQTEPFQPRLESGVELAWHAPAATDRDELILADHRTNVYRVGVKKEPKPHLAMLATAMTKQPIVAPPAALGSLVFVVDASNVLTAYTLPGLAPDKQWTLDEADLGEPLGTGPVVLGGELLVGGRDGTLYQLKQP